MQMQTSLKSGMREGLNGGIQRESFGELLGELANNSAALVRDEIDLAKQEMREKVASLRSGAITVAVGGLLGFVALLTLAAAAVAGLAHVMDTALAALVVGVALALIGGGISMAGIGRLKRTSLKPKQTIETLEEDKEWLKQLT
jgi:Putative Actinobacterial Holin-X, holin superfamily III